MATNNQLMVALLDGQDKVMTFEWNGDLLDMYNPNNFDKSRGDGRVRIIRPDHPSYLVPPSVDTNDSEFNIRAGVPLWLLNTRHTGANPTGANPTRANPTGAGVRRPIVLGIGVMHPRFSSATMVIYDPITDKKIASTYFGDPRHSTHLPWPEGLENYDEQLRWIEENGGDIEPTPFLRPSFNAPWPWNEGLSS